MNIIENNGRNINQIQDARRRLESTIADLIYHFQYDNNVSYDNCYIEPMKQEDGHFTIIVKLKFTIGTD